VRVLLQRLTRGVVRKHQDDTGDVVAQELERDLLAIPSGIGCEHNRGS